MFGLVGSRDLGTGVRSQNVSGTKRNNINPQNTTIMATILLQLSGSVQFRGGGGGVAEAGAARFGDVPEDPAPAEGLDDCCADQGSEILATEQE